jgi:pilus assembly protein Flp/PilA
VEGAPTSHGLSPEFQKSSSKEKDKMNMMLIQLYSKLQDLKNREEGQDLVEYALVVALIAFGSVTAMSALAGGINTAFTQISATLSSNIT